MIYFRSDHAFAFIEGAILKGRNWEWISSTHDRVVYIGTWSLSGNSIHVAYRLISRTVESKKESAFGLLQTEDISLGERTLQFQKNQFEPDDDLENDMEVSLLGVGLITERSIAAETRCPQDARHDLAATQFRVSIGTVTMPIRRDSPNGH